MAEVTTGKYAKHARWRAKNRALGLCPRCGGEPQRGRAQCATCLRKRSVLNKRRRAQRIAAARVAATCFRCGGPNPFAKDGRQLCEKCRAEYNARQREWYLLRKRAAQSTWFFPRRH